jgi:hypothetical protein
VVATKNVTDFVHPHAPIHIINVIIRHGVTRIVTDIDVAQAGIGVRFVHKQHQISTVSFAIHVSGI